MSEDADTEPVVGERRASLGVFPERYQAGDELGRGGMGRVVEAHDKMLGRTVALKEALDTDEEALRRFARETQITARLEHPSIVPVYDAGVSPEGQPFYVMRKVTGRPLDKLIAAANALADRIALLPHVMAACQAVAHAHERGIIHRDLKPSNIVVGAHGETVVLDWGLAKVIGESDEIRKTPEPTAADSLETQAGTVFGTPGFMSPEQSESSNVDERADVYALGATLFYLLAKETPDKGKLGDGVPSELSAIIDKALARDLAARYKTAGALADDLSRFMTGRLVAAHVYSRREMVARFIRKNRALVLTAGAALLVLSIGAVFAVTRIVSARDEALVQARIALAAKANETERASDLVVSQARLLLATNPTAAVAMVRPLAASSRWREVRAVAAGARASGVAWKLPGPSTVQFVDMSFEGTRAVAGGNDGSLHIYDLPSRSHAVLATLKGRVRATFADETHVIAWVGSTFTVIDTETKAQQTFERPSNILRVDGHGGVVYYVDEKRRGWRFEPLTGKAFEIPIDGEITYVAASPDGKHIAFGGANLWLIETKRPDLPEKIHDGKKFDLSWSTSGDHLAAIGETKIFDITVHPEIEIGEYGMSNQSAVLARDTLYSFGLAGFTVAERIIGEADLQSSLIGLYVTRGDFVVGGARDVLRVFDGKHDYQMPLPATPLSLLRASRRSPYILAVCADALLLWNVEHFMPKRVDVPPYSQIITLGAKTAWTLSHNGPTRAIDLHTGVLTEISKLPPIRYASPASGAYLVARPLASRDILILKPDGTGQPIPLEALFAVVLDDKRVVVATKERTVEVYEIAARQSQRIGTFTATIDRVLTSEHSPRWVVATLEDGTVWRHDLQSNASTQTKSSPRSDLFSPGLATSPATPAGDVFFAVDTRVRRWRLDNTVTDHITLPRPVYQIHMIDSARLIVATDDSTGYLVHLDRPNHFAKLAAYGSNYSWSNTGSLVATDDRSGGVSVIDVDANAAWKIAHATPQGSTPSLSGDASTVIMRDATQDSTAVGLWNLDLPQTPEATARWVEDMTNAIFDPRIGMLDWR